MDEKTIIEYINQVDELERKLKGKDKEVLQWLLFGYNKCARLLSEMEHDRQELINYLQGNIEFEQSGSLWASKTRLKTYKEILSRIEKGQKGKE